MLFSGLFRYHMPLLAIHLLWINLMTDSFPAFALGLEQNHEDILEQNQLVQKENIK